MATTDSFSMEIVEILNFYFEIKFLSIQIISRLKGKEWNKVWIITTLPFI